MTFSSLPSKTRGTIRHTGASWRSLPAWCGMILVAGLLVMLGSSPLSQASKPKITWDNVEQNLRASDAADRRAAARQIAVDAPEKQSPQRIVELCRIALADSDAEVRSMAIAALQRITMFQASKNGSPFAKPQLGQTKELYDLLVTTAKDDTLEGVGGMGDSIGAGAITLIGSLFSDVPGVEDAVLKIYEQRKGKARYDAVQGAVIGLLERPEYASSKSREVLFAALADANARVQQAAARVVGSLRPEGGRKALIEAFLQSTNPEAKKRLSNAILAYGDDKAEVEAIRAAAIARAEAAEKLMKFLETKDYRALD